LLDKVKKLKLLNILLIERIRELDLLGEALNAEEELFENHTLPKGETMFGKIIPSDIGSENKFPSFVKNVQVFQTASGSNPFQKYLKNRKNISTSKEPSGSINIISSKLHPSIGQIQKKLIENDFDNQLSDQEVGNNLLSLGRNLVGRSFHSSFLLLKYKLHQEQKFKLFKKSLILSK
jgi:hypothetical protein